MTQEERRQKRQKDTKNAVLLFVLLLGMIAALIVGAVLLVGRFIKNSDGKPAADNNSGSGTTIESDVGQAETEKPLIDPLAQQAIGIVSEMSLEEKVAQMFIITPDALTNVKNATAAGNKTKESYKKYPVGGLIYMSGNLKGREQTKEMLTTMKAFSQEIVGLPIFLGVEEEGGSVTTIASKTAFGVSSVSKMSEIGATGDATNAYNAGATIGGYLKELGFNVNFAPSADVLTNAENAFLKERSFGSDSGNVSNMVLSMLQGLKENGIYGVVKHFPGHGSTVGNSSDGAVASERTLDELKASELVPFQNAMNAGASFIMVGHISVPNITGNNIPSSLSEYMIGQVLRDEMGYKGIVITDAMNKKAITANYDSAEAAVTAIAAGADMILMPADFEAAYKGVVAAVKNGSLTEEQINSAVVRIVKVKLAMYE